VGRSQLTVCRNRGVLADCSSNQEPQNREWVQRQHQQKSLICAKAVVLLHPIQRHLDQQPCSIFIKSEQAPNVVKVPPANFSLSVFELLLSCHCDTSKAENGASTGYAGRAS